MPTPYSRQCSAAMREDVLRSSASLTDWSLADRAEQIVAACAAAVELEQVRRQNGFPPTQPAPWPDSTWEFLSACCREFHRVV